MTNILYIDTSGNFSHIMLFNEEKIYAIKKTTELNQHAQSINTHIKEILQETNFTWKDINAIAVLNGPGSYTGLRIGLASAKGFCYAHDIPLILLNHFDLLHYCNEQTNHTTAYIIKARVNEYFFATLSNKNAANNSIILLTKNEIIDKKDSENLHFFTSDENLTQEFKDIHILITNEKCIQSFVLQQFMEQKFYNVINSEPFYLKSVYINKIKNA